MKFHENLIALRRREGWSQEELGNRIGVTRQTVSKWELGLTTPELEKLVQLADVFGMTTDQLVGRLLPQYRRSRWPGRTLSFMNTSVLEDYGVCPWFISSWGGADAGPRGFLPLAMLRQGSCPLVW
jgi:transcriptional regulator with XRE-family HTH domain